MKQLTSDEALQAMKSAKIKVKPYVRGPLGKERVSLAKTPSGDGLRAWFPENAKYFLATSPKNKQILLRVKEKAGRIENQTGFNYLNSDLKLREKLKKRWKNQGLYDVKTLSYSEFLEIGGKLPDHYRKENIERELYNFMPDSVFVPQKVALRNTRNDYEIRLLGYSKNRSTTQTFLIGVDEKKHFISPLKTNKAESVKDAHRELRPKNISSRAIRHGEWFFDPISKEKELEILRTIPSKIGSWRMRGGISQRRQSLESGSTHQAHTLRLKGKLYAIGKVVDTRKGYHKPIELPSLHRVVRNNELEIDQSRRVNFD